MITVSIVSHGHVHLLSSLFEELAMCPAVSQIVLTHNIPEPAFKMPAELVERTVVQTNSAPKGFGANHNAAFVHCDTPLFCIMNPDVNFHRDPFPVLLNALGEDVALCAPAVLDPSGRLEDSARHFPRPWGLLMKALGVSDGRHVYSVGEDCFSPEWVAGMFMLIRARDFANIEGFDEGFFLYYEDVDLCVRLWRAGRIIKVCPRVTVVHDARRASHRNPKYLAWHLNSMARYLVKHFGRLPVVCQ